MDTRPWSFMRERGSTESSSAPDGEKKTIALELGGRSDLEDVLEVVNGMIKVGEGTITHLER